MYYENTTKHYETFYKMEAEMRKRGVALLVAAALAVTGLSGCGAASGEASSGREKVRLMVWSPQNDQSKDNG